jgi:hypothetical protein
MLLKLEAERQTMRSGSAVTGGRGSLSESAYLAAVGVVGLVGWGGTAAVTHWTGTVAELVAPSVAVVAVWSVLVGLLFWVGFGRTVPAVRSNWMLPVWAVASTAALAVNVATLAGLTGRWGAYGLVHPWLLVYVLGYAAQVVEVNSRRRLTYLGGTALGVGVLLGAVDVAFPWVTLFALLGAVHAAPLLADAAMLRAGLVARTDQVPT